MANIEERVESLIRKTIEELDYELYDVIYEKEAQDYYLRIFIDKPEGIDINDCEKVNDSITDMLDEANYIKEQYFLEVSSPGIERLLRKDKQLQANIGKEITLKLFKPIEIEKQEETKKNKNTTKEIDGILKEFNEEKLSLILENREIEINRKDIATIRVKYNWN